MERTLRPLMGILFATACLLVFGCGGVNPNIARGDELAKAGLFDEALEAYELAADLERDDPELDAKIVQTKKQLAKAVAAEGARQLEAGDAFAAVLAYKRAITLDSSQGVYKQQLKKAALQRVGEGQKALEKKQFVDAIGIFKGLLGELPRFNRAKQGLKDAQLAWSEGLLHQAVDYQDRGLPGNALIELLKLRKMVGEYGDSAERERACRAKLADAATFGLRVTPARVKRRQVASTAKLVQRLQRVPIPGCSRTPESGAARVTVRVGVKATNFKQERALTMGQSKYQSGTRPVDNPAFLELEEKIEKTRARIAELEQALTQDKDIVEQRRQAFADAGPSDDDAALREKLKAAEKTQADHQTELGTRRDEVLAMRNQLSRTPRKLDEPVYDTHEYEIFEITRRVVIQAELSAKGEGGQVLIRSAAVEGVAETKDKANKAAARYGVKADPLAFPMSDEELIDTATDQLAESAGARLADLCTRWQGEILERARQGTDAAELEAIEDYVLYLFASDGPPPKDLVNYLHDKRDFEDLGAIRGGK